MEYCEWIKDDVLYVEGYPRNAYRVGCGGCGEYVTCINDNFIYCPYCGRKIKEVK